MHGSGIAIMSFSNGNSADGNTVELKLVSGSNTMDLATAKTTAKHDVVFPYNNGDEVVLSETNTGTIVVHSLKCADSESDFKITNGVICDVDNKEKRITSIGDLKGVLHKKEVWGQDFWEHPQMTPKLCSTLCAQTRSCLGFSQKNAGDGNLGSCKLFNTIASLTPTTNTDGSCGRLATALITTPISTPTTTPPSTFFDRLTKQWGGWVGISIVVAGTSIVIVVVILCATCCIYALCRRCAKKRNAHRNPAPVHAIPSHNASPVNRAPKRLSSTPPDLRSPEGYPRGDLRDLHHDLPPGPSSSLPLPLPTARTALPVMHENSQFEAPLNPDEEMIRDHINRLKLEIKTQNEHKLACETSGQYEEAERTAARIWQLEERLDRSEEKLFMLIENNADEDMHPGNSRNSMSRNSMPLPPHQPVTSPYPPAMAPGNMSPDTGPYASPRDDGEKTYNNINEKLEQLQMRIKHAQTEEEADRCEAEIWELLNALKEENDNLKLERTVDLTQPTPQTDEYGDPTRGSYQSTPLLQRDRQSYAEPPPPQHNDDKPGQHLEAGAQNPWAAADSAGMMHGRGMMMQRDAMSHGVMRRDMGPFAGRGAALRRDAASYGGMQHDPAAFRASRKMHPNAGSFHTVHAGMHPESRPFAAPGMMHPDAGSFHSTHSGQMPADPQSVNSHHSQFVCVLVQ